MNKEGTDKVSYETHNQYVTFIICEEFYAIDVMLVESIERVTEITPVPKARKHVLGVINIRGDIVPVISLRQRLSMKDIEYTERTRIIITGFSEYRVGILVDEVRDVCSVDLQRVQTGEDIFKEGRGELISQVIEHDGKYILVLDVPKILGLEDKGDKDNVF